MHRRLERQLYAPNPPQPGISITGRHWLGGKDAAKQLPGCYLKRSADLSATYV